MNLTEVEGFITRDGTTDANAVYAIVNDEYNLWTRSWSGWAIDIGAYVGSVAITLARQNPDLRVLAVEAVPENADLLAENVARHHVADRVTVVRGYASAPGKISGTCHYGYRHRETESDGYVSAHRYVGNTWIHLGEPEFSVEMPAVTLPGLMADYGIDALDLLKIDCEGCEWGFLETDLSAVRVIIGEYHGGYGGEPGYVPYPANRIRELLGPTHDVTMSLEDPSVGLFEGIRR